MSLELVDVDESVPPDYDSSRSPHPPSYFKTTIVSKHSAVSDRAQTNDTLYNILRPALTVLRVFGLIHNVDWVRSRDKSSSPWTVSKAYNLAVLIVLWHCPLRLITIYEASDFAGIQSYAFMKLITHIWILSCSINGGILFYVFHCKERMKKLFALYEHVSCHYDCGNRQVIQRRVRIITGIAVTLFIVTSLSFLFLFFCNIPQLYALAVNGLAPFHKSEWIKSNTPVKLVFFSFLMFNVAVSVSSIMLFFIVCFLIVGMQKSFNAYVAKRLRDDGTLDCNFVQLRMHFMRICDVIEAANGVFQNYIGANLVIFVVNTGLVIWSLLSTNMFATNPYAAIYHIYWTFYQMLQLLILSYGAGMVNDKAYEFAGVIYHVRTVNTEKGDDVQVNMLLAKLNGPAIGFSAFDLFIVDKPSIISVFGMLLSYLLVMVEMSSNASGSSSSCAQVAVNTTLANTTGI